MTAAGTVTRLRVAVAEDLAGAAGTAVTVADRRELARDLALRRIRADAALRLAAGDRPPSPEEEHRLAQSVVDALLGLGRLEELIADPSVENIDVNGCDTVWVTRADGTKERVDPVADSDDELVELVRAAAARVGLSERRFDTAHPELDLRLPDGSRLSALMAVVSRPALSIRRHRLTRLTLDDLVDAGSLAPATADLLAACVRARKNIVVAGAMNSGKTTLLRALAAHMHPRERVVTIEQALELGLDADGGRHPDLVALEARLPNAEGEGAVPMDRLVRRALRMNADRVIVGEVLGDEVLPMLNAMSQGRAGSMCTIHADSSEGAFRRMATYAVQSPQRLPVEATNLLVAGAVHFVVFVDAVDTGDGPPAGTGGPADRFPARRRRRVVSSVREVVGADGLQVVSNEVLRPGPDRRAVPGAPLRSTTRADLVAHGLGDGGRW